MNRLKIAAATVGVAAVTALMPLGIGGAAHADTEEDGCTVKPYAPTVVRNGQVGPSGRPMVKYKVDVTCIQDVDVEIDQDFWEQDLESREGPFSVDDEYFGDHTEFLSFPSGGGFETFTTKVELPSTGPVENGTEEVYQAVQFEVTASGVHGGWTAEELTQPTEINR